MKARVAVMIATLAVTSACTDAEVLRIKRFFYPHDYQMEPPVRVEIEPVRPVEPVPPAVIEPEPVPPVLEHPIVPQLAPPVVPVPRPVVRPPRERARTPVTPSRRMQPRRAADEGPDLPWPCWMVRMRAGGKSDAEMRKMGRDNNVKLSAKQERQALACLGRK